MADSKYSEPPLTLARGALSPGVLLSSASGKRWLKRAGVILLAILAVRGSPTARRALAALLDVARRWRAPTALGALALYAAYYFTRVRETPELTYRRTDSVLARSIKAAKTLHTPWLPTFWAANGHLQLMLYVHTHTPSAQPTGCRWWRPPTRPFPFP